MLTLVVLLCITAVCTAANSDASGMSTQDLTKMLADSMNVLHKDSPSDSAQVAQLEMMVEWRCTTDCAVTHRSQWEAIFDGTSMQDVVRPPATSSQSQDNNKELVNNLLWKSTEMTDEEQLTVWNRTCSTYTAYQKCLGMCPQGQIVESLKSAMGSLRVLCAVSAQDYLAASKCLSVHESAHIDECSHTMDQLAAATNNLQNTFGQTSIQQKLSRTQWANVIVDFCRASVTHSECTLPLIKTKCDAKSADMMASLLRETMSQSSMLLGRLGVVEPKECKRDLIDVDSAMSKYEQMKKLKAEVEAADESDKTRLGVRSLEPDTFSSGTQAWPTLLVIVSAVIISLL